MNCLFARCLAFSMLSLLHFNASAQGVTSTLLLRQPSISADHLAFVYGGNIWLTDRRGEHPVRLTSSTASESSPHFSPDGKWVAFSANYDNNTDVYVISVDGGQPRRLTWHPAADVVAGWSVDGKRVLFASNRQISNSRSNQLYEVALEGGAATRIMPAVAYTGAWSPDGHLLAYQPTPQAYAGTSGWRQYRGGETPPIWIIDPKANTLIKVPHENASDIRPFWIGTQVGFISDRNDGAANLFVFDPDSKTLRQLTSEHVWDVRNASSYGSSVVYEVGGQLKSLDVTTGNVTPIDIHLDPQSEQLRPRWRNAAEQITSIELSPTGKRLLVAARGDIFTVPVKDGSTRNLTQTSAIKEGDAMWSHDGREIAYLSDADMHPSLVIRDQDGISAPKFYSLGKSGYLSLLAWSPNGNLLVYNDAHLNLYAFSRSTGKSTLIDSSLRRASPEVSFSSDSRWLAYDVTQANYFSQIRIHDFSSNKNMPLTDPLIDARSPAFADKDYLYFTQSINSGPTLYGLDLSSRERPVRRGIYVAVLAASGKSPLLPKTGDEGTAEDKTSQPAGDATAPDDTDKPVDKTAEKNDGRGKSEIVPDTKQDGTSDKLITSQAKPIKPVRIDFEGIADRIVALPVAERNYDSLVVASDGALFYLQHSQQGDSIDSPEVDPRDDAQLIRFNFDDRKASALKSELSTLGISADGKKLFVGNSKNHIEQADAKDKPDFKNVDLSQVRLLVDPKAEWQQIFDDTWRMEREYFYDPNLHGLNWDAIYARYQPLLKYVVRREDLNALLVEMIGELQVGHNRIGGGDVHHEASDNVGLLGADIELKAGHYRIAKILRGDASNPFLAAPLAAPGLGIHDGDEILAVNGQPLDPQRDFYAAFENTVGKQVSLLIDTPDKKAARTVVVVPVDSEMELRRWDWIEHNRGYVDRISHGTVGYIYLPDTGDDGFAYFNRMFFAQVDKQALIIDERRNSGGQAANYITEVLGRPLLSGWKDRDGLVSGTPAAVITGPKIMLIDQDAGSGGDFLPYAFKRQKIGTLIGTRTWGGLIGISTNPPLIDGGNLSVPFFRVFSPEGQWVVENQGVSPDLEVELDPILTNQNRDAQLEAAVSEAMAKLAAAPAPHLITPPPVKTVGQ